MDDLICGMGKQATIVRFLKPSLWTAIILGIFIPVALLGHIQTYAFTCGGDGHKCVGTDIQKPPLFDAIRGYPFWLIWVFSIAPLIPFASAIQSYLVNFEGTVYIFFAANFIYYYLASCVIAFSWNKFRQIKWFDDTRQLRS